jgi:Helix-turn-helix domain
MPATVITPEDLQAFKKELLEDIKKLLSEQKNAQERKWLKSGEVRKLLALSHGTLLQMRVNGVLPYTKIGGVIYYEYDDIKKMIDRHKQNIDSYQ